MVERAKATRKSWKELNSMPNEHSVVMAQRAFSDGEYEMISYGHVPDSMDDKWLIFLEDETLFFHRSWTGNCIYELVFQKEDQGYKSTRLRVNRDPDQYKSAAPDEYDIALLFFLIDNFLLGRNTPFPILEEESGSFASGVLQHSFSGTGYPEKEFGSDGKRESKE